MHAALGLSPAPAQTERVRAAVGHALILASFAAINAALTTIRQRARSQTKTEVEHGKDQESKTKTEGTSGAFNMPYLGVRSMKTLSSSCN